jgi:hypothetical protein
MPRITRSGLEAIAMIVSTPQNPSFRIRMLLALVASAIAAIAVPHGAHAADADSGQNVECMLPGQIHTVGGHATMGPRHPEQTTAADCRARGGEYTVSEQPVAPPPVAQAPARIASDNKLVRCLLPQQERQLGQKARYTIAQRTIRATRYDCRQRGGKEINATRAHHPAPKK